MVRDNNVDKGVERTALQPLPVKPNEYIYIYIYIYKSEKDITKVCAYVRARVCVRVGGEGERREEEGRAERVRARGSKNRGRKKEGGRKAGREGEGEGGREREIEGAYSEG